MGVSLTILFISLSHSADTSCRGELQRRVAEGARFSVVFVAGHVPVAILPVKSMRMREKKA